jgi:hypothetical protein
MALKIRNMKIKAKAGSLLEKVRARADDILFYAIVLGVIMLSAGVYIMGSGIDRPIGRDLIILGSGIFYVSVVILVFRL